MISQHPDVGLYVGCMTREFQFKTPTALGATPKRPTWAIERKLIKQEAPDDLYCSVRSINPAVPAKKGSMRGCSLLLFCVALALATATCPANTYYDQEQKQCLACPPGTTSEQGPSDHNSPGCKCDGMPKVLSGAFPIVWSLSFFCAAGCLSALADAPS